MVHWEINDKDPGVIKLHVESPRNETDGVLNAIKQKMIQAFLSHPFKDIAETNGCGYQIGSKIDSRAIQDHKSTEPFRIILPKDQRANTHEANIELVDDMAGEAVREIIQRFRPKLDAHFAA